MKNSIMNNSYLVIICTGLSRLLGIFRSRVLAFAYGAGGIADALNFSYGLPNNLRKIFAEGAWQQTMQPAFSTSVSGNATTHGSVQALLARLQALQLIVFVPLVLVAWVFRIPIVMLASDFAEQEIVLLAANLLVWFSLFLAFIGFGSLYSSLLHAHGFFFTAALAPVVSSIAVIAAVIVGAEACGPHAMAYGTVAGAFLQSLWNWISLSRLGYRFQVSFDFSDLGFKMAIQSWLRISLLSGINLLVQQYAFFLASGMAPGSLTATSYAIVLYQAPFGMFANGISTVLAPALSTANENKNKNELTSLVYSGMQALFMLLLPASIVLCILGKEIVAVLLQGGGFSSESTIVTARILSWYAGGMVAMGWHSFLARFCIATGDSKTPLIVGIIASMIDVLVMSILADIGFGPASLGAGTLVSSSVASIVLFIKKSNDFSSKPILGFVGRLAKIAACNLPLSLGLVVYGSLHAKWYEQGLNIVSIIILATLGASSVLLVAGMYRLLDLALLESSNAKSSLVKPGEL